MCKLAIENFMQPNLALLVDLGPHSKELGPMLFKRLHDVNWEVQDSALEVLNTMAIVSEESKLMIHSTASMIVCFFNSNLLFI